MHIRPLTQADLKAITQLEAIAQAGAWTAEVFLHCFNVGYPGWALEKEDHVIGFVIVSIQLEECHILNICIHPDYQRQGLGEKLLLFLLEELKQRNTGTAFLEVRRSNYRAIQLYEKLDFIQIGVRASYYPAKHGNEDALVFAKDLTIA